MGDFNHIVPTANQKQALSLIEACFESLGNEMTRLLMTGREKAIVRTKLQEACFWAKKSVCECPDFLDPVNRKA